MSFCLLFPLIGILCFIGVFFWLLSIAVVGTNGILCFTSDFLFIEIAFTVLSDCHFMFHGCCFVVCLLQLFALFPLYGILCSFGAYVLLIFINKSYKPWGWHCYFYFSRYDTNIYIQCIQFQTNIIRTYKHSKYNEGI